jgi:hypothetical protein
MDPPTIDTNLSFDDMKWIVDETRTPPNSPTSPIRVEEDEN